MVGCDFEIITSMAPELCPDSLFKDVLRFCQFSPNLVGNHKLTISITHVSVSWDTLPAPPSLGLWCCYAVTSLTPFYP